VTRYSCYLSGTTACFYCDDSTQSDVEMDGRDKDCTVRVAISHRVAHAPTVGLAREVLSAVLDENHVIESHHLCRLSSLDVYDVGLISQVRREAGA
jgi:hypothetical protein